MLSVSLAGAAVYRSDRGLSSSPALSRAERDGLHKDDFPPPCKVA